MECARAQVRGWFRDPFGRHEDRYFSLGAPTKLVRDAGVESYDPPPRGARMRRPLVAVEGRPIATGGPRDMRRADDGQGDRDFDPFRTAFDTAVRYGSFG